MQRMDNERPSFVMQGIESMDDERRRRIEAVIRDVEGVTMDFDESPRTRSIKDLIGEVCQLVQDLLDAGPRLQFLEDKIWPWKISAEPEEACGILTRVHHREIVALGKEHEKAMDVIRSMYSRTERRRLPEVDFLGAHIMQLKIILYDNYIVYDIEPMPDCEEMSAWLVLT